MAAYAALVSLMHIIDAIEHHHSPPISLDKQQVESLTQIVTFLQEFLEGYNSPVADGDEADPLEMRIADAAYAAEDVIESHIVEKIQRSRSKETKTSRFFNWFQGPKDPKNVSSSVDANHDDEETNLYQDLQHVIEEMDLTKRVAMKIDTEKAMVHHQPQTSVSASATSLRSSSSSIGQNSNMVVCSEDVLLEIMEKLVAGWSDRQVIPIIGMGGIGKTTLARTVYSKPLIKEYFDIHAWATISQHYDTREILSELVSQATNKKREELSERSEDELGLELHKNLFGRRYLIVMDDMWSIEAWDKIQNFFPNNGNGSRVLVTTRLSQLGSQLNNNYSLQMEFLDEVSSWDLFSKTVFGEKNCPIELEKIGKKIVHNCRGLPLSIVVVGGILKKMKHTQRCWESIRNNLTSTVNLENDKHCLRLLNLSYNSLPVYLKPYFLYMGVFEEDSAIGVSTLVRLWVSEGFLKSVNGSSLETVAEGFLKDLVDRNLILIDKLGSTGNIKFVKVHDLVRDLCLNQGEKDGFYHVIGQSSPPGINSQRRVVIPRNTSKKKVREALQSMPHARSVICAYGKVPRFQNFGMLRTLHAYYKGRHYRAKSHVNSLVFKNVNLRHLAAEVGSMSSIFSSLNLLWNLHTLIVSCPDKSTAPTEIWKMPQLRHIELSERRMCLPDPSSDDVVMENLHTLKGVHNFKCGEEVVKRIPNIKKLEINYSGSEGHDDYYCLSNIKYLCKLESLYVFCEFDFRGNASLYKLAFPHSLKSLTLDVVIGDFEWEEMLEKIGSLALLEKFKLWGGCFGTGKWEVVEGQFPSLKYLGLFLCKGLKHWIAQESSIFPRLEQLHLFGLPDLKEIPSEIGNIPTLQKLLLMDCSKSTLMSVKEIVEEQVELQGEQLPFHIEVKLWKRNKTLMQSLSGPNFDVRVGIDVQSLARHNARIGVRSQIVAGVFVFVGYEYRF